MAAGVASQEAEVHILGGNADSVEFCPIEGFHSFLAAATYNLVEGDVPKREGQLYLFEAETKITPEMRKSFERATPGIFDLKWSPQPLQGAPCLSQASADGSLSFYSMQNETSASLDLHTTCAVSDAMCLSLDWQPGSSEKVVVSQSDGQISLVDFAPEAARVSQAWLAHELEVWVASFDRWDANLVYSGADDCTVKGWDVRTDCDTPVFTIRREHTMGVCTVASDPFREHMFVTGSYDERVRLWDNRVLSRPVCVHASAQVGGGVWRLRWHPYTPGLLLGACMHGGARIFQVEESGEISVREEYTAHTSLTYGADWCYASMEPVRTAAGFGANGDSEEEACFSERAASRPGKSSGVNDVLPHSGETESVGVSRKPHQVDRVIEDKETLKAQPPSTNEVSKAMHGQLKHSPNIVATCSFYDRALHLWTPSGLKLNRLGACE